MATARIACFVCGLKFNTEDELNQHLKFALAHNIKEVKMKKKCPSCGGSEIRYRMTTKDSWCRRCGKVFKDKEVKYD